MADDRTTPPGTAPPPGAAPDPSMEDILASIRRILSEDEASGGAAATPPPIPPKTPDGPAEPLELTEEMLVLRSAEPGPPPASAAAPDLPPAAPLPAPEPPPAPVPVPVATPASQLPSASASAPGPDAETDATGMLLGPAAAAAAVASMGALLRAVAADRGSAVTRGGPSIEDVVREELRPLLKDWLDAHLPPLVERLVRAEIERVVGRALS